MSGTETTEGDTIEVGEEYLIQPDEKVTRHPLSSLLGGMAEEDFDALKQNIKLAGQRDPVIMIGDQVIDGWHRVTIGRDLKRPVRAVPYIGSNPAAYVLKISWGKGRTLTASQRAARAVVFATMKKGDAGAQRGGEEIALTFAEAARFAGVSRSQVKSARLARDGATAGEWEDVLAGKLSINALTKRIEDRNAKSNKATQPETTMDKLSIVPDLPASKVADVPALTHGDLLTPVENDQPTDHADPLDPEAAEKIATMEDRLRLIAELVAALKALPEPARGQAVRDHGQRFLAIFDDDAAEIVRTSLFEVRS